MSHMARTIDQNEDDMFGEAVCDDALERIAVTGRAIAANPTVPSAIICIPFKPAGEV
jgi:hypothetical protein